MIEDRKNRKNRRASKRWIADDGSAFPDVEDSKDDGRGRAERERREEKEVQRHGKLSSRYRALRRAAMSPHHDSEIWNANATKCTNAAALIDSMFRTRLTQRFAEKPHHVHQSITRTALSASCCSKAMPEGARVRMELPLCGRGTLVIRRIGPGGCSVLRVFVD